jgi:LysM repeat protein
LSPPPLLRPSLPRRPRLLRRRLARKRRCLPRHRAANAPAGEREGPPSPTPIPLSPIGTSADRASGPSDVESGLEGRVTDASTGHGLPGAVVAYHGPVEGPGYAQARNRAGVVADTLTTDNLALAPMAGASVVPFQTVTDQRSGQAVAAYGYPVRPGDTLRAIAERAGTTVDEILALNRIDDADRLEPGRLLYLPASTFGQK